MYNVKLNILTLHVEYTVKLFTQSQVVTTENNAAGVSRMYTICEIFLERGGELQKWHLACAVSKMACIVMCCFHNGIRSDDALF